MPEQPTRPTQKVAAAAKTGAALTVASIVALILGADPDDPAVQGIAAALLALAPVAAAYQTRERRR